MHSLYVFIFVYVCLCEGEKESVFQHVVGPQTCSNDSAIPESDPHWSNTCVSQNHSEALHLQTDKTQPQGKYLNKMYVLLFSCGVLYYQKTDLICAMTLKMNCVLSVKSVSWTLSVKLFQKISHLIDYCTVWHLWILSTCEFHYVKRK